MKVTVVQTLDEMIALRDRWQTLLNQCSQNHVFMTWEWALTWWNHFAEGRKLFILVVEDGRNVVGILPLMLYIRRGKSGEKRYLHFIGFRFGIHWNDWMDIIAVHKAEVIRAALAYLEKCQHLWDFLDLWDVPEESDTVRALTEQVARSGFSVEKRSSHVCPYLPTVSDWDAYYRSSSSKRVSGDPERQIRRLRAKGNLQIEWAQNSDPMMNLELLFELYQRRQTTRHLLAMFSEEVYRDFYRALARAFPREALDCSVLKLEGKVIAGHFGFRYNRKLYFCTPVFDPDYTRFAPGRVLLRYMIENCFTDPKIDEFDFLAGSEPYKYEWATGERRACRLMVTNAYLAGWTGKVLRRVPYSIRRSLVEGLQMFGYSQRSFAKQETRHE